MRGKRRRKCPRNPMGEGAQWISPPLSFLKRIGQLAEVVHWRQASAELATPTVGRETILSQKSRCRQKLCRAVLGYSLRVVSSSPQVLDWPRELG